jgi:hypothetical protein
MAVRERLFLTLMHHVLALAFTAGHLVMIGIHIDVFAHGFTR